RVFHYEDDKRGWIKQGIVQKIGSCWRNSRNHLFHKVYDEELTFEQNIKRKPPGIEANHWKKFLQYRLDEDTKVVTITVGVVSVAVGIGLPVFYESQIDNAAKRENTHCVVVFFYFTMKKSKSSDKCPDGQTLGTYGSATVGLILIFSVPPRIQWLQCLTHTIQSLWNLNPTFCMNQNIESIFGLLDEDIISTFWSRIMREEAKILVEEETTTTTTDTILSGEMEFM
ncbi:hypothetical protein S245_001160, partial [Arachis hypogaea]